MEFERVLLVNPHSHAEWRGLTIVKNNDRSAFVYGTIATDIAALEAI